MPKVESPEIPEDHFKGFRWATVIPHAEVQNLWVCILYQDLYLIGLVKKSLSYHYHTAGCPGYWPSAGHIGICWLPLDCLYPLRIKDHKAFILDYFLWRVSIVSYRALCLCGWLSSHLSLAIHIASRVLKFACATHSLQVECGLIRMLSPFNLVKCL